MSAFRFLADRDGNICGGSAIVGVLSSETWKIPKACPVRSLEECGVEIAWHGEPFDHQHYTWRHDETLPKEAA